MFLSRLKITNVRNHKNSSYDLEKENIFIGENGSGKTTVLESIYLLFAMRGFKKQPLSNIISFNEKFLRIEGKIKTKDTENDIILKYNGHKSLYFNDYEIEKISDFMYDYPIACYTPEAPGILSSSQTDRRNFLDRFIFYTNKSHIEDIKVYNRFISQKNAYLNDEKYDETYIKIINEKIINLSKIISNKRINFIETVNKSLKELYSSLNFPIEEVFISYKTNTNNHDILKKEKLSKRAEYGIHRDKIDMCLDGKIIEKFSSVGQKKTFILLCLLTAVKNVEIKRKISIISLLDDFEATLDKKRAVLLKEFFCCDRQTLFTGVESERLKFENVIQL